MEHLSLEVSAFPLELVDNGSGICYDLSEFCLGVLDMLGYGVN